MKKQFTITILIADDGGTLAYRTLLALLKNLLRGWGIRCTGYTEQPPLAPGTITAEELNEMRDRGEPS